MIERVLNQARRWGFITRVNEEEVWLILPQQEQQRWKLQQTEDQRWLLSMDDVPQIYLHPHEVIAFLERRYAARTRRD